MNSIKWNLDCMEKLNNAAQECMCKLEYGHSKSGEDNYELAARIETMCQDIQYLYDDLMADYGE